MVWFYRKGDVPQGAAGARTVGTDLRTVRARRASAVGCDARAPSRHALRRPAPPCAPTCTCPALACAQLLYTNDRHTVDARFIRHPAHAWFLRPADPEPTMRCGHGQQRCVRAARLPAKRDAAAERALAPSSLLTCSPPSMALPCPPCP